MSTATASAAISPSPVPAPDLEAALPLLLVPEAQQWLSTTTGRVAPDGYSWLQAVHWAVGPGLYVPQRRHGPRAMGPTTIKVAQLLARLSPCRPGVAYLARRLAVTDRTVEYHLEMLRESGLLAYVTRGTRVRGGPPQASQFALIIPIAFDEALEIRTKQRDTDAPTYTRAMVGITDSGRALMAQLARKAARKVRAPRTPKASKRSRKGTGKATVTTVSDGPRCTPMGGRSFTSRTGSTSFPPEKSKLASGKPRSPRRTSRNGRRKLNAVGRRFRLAAELIRRVPWMGRAAVPRIAWIVREVADAGWTADEIIAWLDCGDIPEHVSRPSGFLAQRLVGAVRLWPTANGRARAVEVYRDSRRAEHARHATWEGSARPASQSVARLFDEAVARLREREMLARPTLYTLTLDDIPPTPPELSEEERTDMQAAAQKDSSLVTSIVNTYGEAYAREVFTNDVVDLTLCLRGTSHLVINQPWEIV